MNGFAMAHLPGALALEASGCGLSRAHSAGAGVIIDACRRAIVQPVQVPHRAVLDSTRSRAGVVSWRCYVVFPSCRLGVVRDCAKELVAMPRPATNDTIAPASGV